MGIANLDETGDPRGRGWGGEDQPVKGRKRVIQKEGKTLSLLGHLLFIH